MDEPLPNTPRVLGQTRSAWGDGAPSPEPAPATTPRPLDTTADDDPLPTPPSSPGNNGPPSPLNNHAPPPRLDLPDNTDVVQSSLIQVNPMQLSPIPTEAARAVEDMQSPLPPMPPMSTAAANATPAPAPAPAPTSYTPTSYTPASHTPAPAPAPAPEQPTTVRQENDGSSRTSAAMGMPPTSVSMMSMASSSDGGSYASGMTSYSAPAAPPSHAAPAAATSYSTPQQQPARSAMPVLTLEPVALTPWQQRQQQQARQAHGGAGASAAGGGGGAAPPPAAAAGAGAGGAAATSFAAASDGGSQFKSLDFMNGLKVYLRSLKMGSRWRRFQRFTNAISGKELVDSALTYMQNSGQARFANAQRSQAAALVQRTIQRGGAFTCVAVPGKPFKDTKSRIYTLAPELSI